MMKNKLKYLLLFTSTIFALEAKAGCVPERHFTPVSCIPFTVEGISGSNAEVHLQKTQADMSVVGGQLSTTIMQVMQDLGTVFSKQMQGMSKIEIENSQNALNNEIEREQNFMEMRKAIELDKAKKEELSKKANHFSDDTEEEMKVILDELEEHGDDVSILKIATILKETYDKTGTKIPIRMHGSEGVCDDEAVEEGKCATLKKITPGRKLIVFHQECTKQKRKLVVATVELDGKVAAIQSSSKKVNRALNNTSSKAAISQSIAEQRDLSCNIEQYKNKLCLQDISKEDYQEMVASGVIVMNANVNPANALYPTGVGGLSAGLVSDKESRESFEHNSLDHTELEEFPMQNQNEVPIVYTYRNVNQLKGALDLVDNLVGDNLVANQDPEKRKAASSLEFQSRYLNRVATLSLARQVMVNSIRLRAGKNLAKTWKGNVELEGLDLMDPEKESSMGAGKIDLVFSDIDSTFAQLTVNADDTSSHIKKGLVKGETADNYWKNETLRVLKVQNEMLLREYMQNETLELLKAAQLATNANAPANVIHLRRLRRGE
jgi:archaellum component FlaC